MKNYYLILGVSPQARQREIKEAFRKLCLKYHPDRTIFSVSADERYIDICEAYKVLSNPGRRTLYDKRLARLQKKAENINGRPSSLKDAILPEIKTSYKGHYPWFAIFSIIIVCAIALIFLYTRQTEGITASPRISLLTTTPTITAPVVTLDTIKAQMNTDSVKGVIVSTLKSNTPKIILENLDNNSRPNAVFSYKEQHYNYRFKGKKLVVTYDIGYQNSIIKKQVSIPYHDIAYVYQYKQHLWICNDKESITDVNLNTGYSYKTDFFSVKFDTTNSAEAQLLSAFSQLKRI